MLPIERILLIYNKLMNETKMYTTDKTFWDKTSFKNIIKKSIPMILAAMLAALVPFVDNVIAGSISSVSEAGVTYALTIQFVVFVIALGTIGAISVVAAQYNGASNSRLFRDAHKLKIVSTVFISLIGAVLVFVIPEQLLGIFTTKQSVIDDSKDFLRLYGVVFILMSINMSYRTSLTSLGHTKIALLITVLGVVLNTTGDLLFVHVFDMGTSGLAYATIIVQSVVFSAYVIYAKLLKEDRVFFNIFKIFNIDKEVIIKTFHRWHMVIVEVSFSMGILIVQVIMARSYDHTVSSGTILGVVTPFTKVMTSGITGFYAANAIFVGANLGKDKFKLAKMNAKRVLLSSFIIVMSFTAIIAGTSQWLVKVYTKIDEHSLHQGVMILRLYVILVPSMLLGILNYRFLESGGQSKTVMIFDAVYTWVFLVLGTYLIFYVWTPDEFWIAFVVSKLIQYVRAFVSWYFVSQDLWLVNLTKEKAKPISGNTLVVISVMTLGIYPMLLKLKQRK